MTDKPKISHFASTDLSEPIPKRNKDLDRSDLGMLYPTPKTYEQRKEAQWQRQQSNRRRWPKYPHLNIALYGTFVCILLLWFSQRLDTWLFSTSDEGMAMSIVFSSFAIAIVLTFLLIAWIVYVNKQFDFFGGLIRVFWLVYMVPVAILLVLWVSGWPWEYTNISWIPVLTTLHFIAVLLSAKYILGRTSYTSQ